MAPFMVNIRVTALNTSNLSHPSSPTSTPPFSSSTGVNDNIINIVFGMLACVIGVITIWQAHRTWRIWHTNHNSSIPRGRSHIQNGNNVPPPPYPGTPYTVADGLRTLLHMTAETMANGLPPSDGPTTSIPSERSGMQLPRATPILMEGLTSHSTDDENIEHASGVVREQQH